MILSILMAAFILIPILELAVLLQVGDWIGGWNTLALVVGTGFAGALLAREQGWRVMTQLQRELQEGRAPTDCILNGVIILVAGVLMITPGLLTDLAGFFLLLPPSRAVMATYIRRLIRKKLKMDGPGVILDV